MTKNISLLLALLKVAGVEQKTIILVPLKKINLEVLGVLYKLGVIQNFKVIKNNSIIKSKILVYLRFFFTKPVFKKFKMLSKPSLLFFLKYEDICFLQDQRHTLILSTPRGILTNYECKLYGCGGIVLFNC